MSGEIVYEEELAVLIGKRGKDHICRKSIGACCGVHGASATRRRLKATNLRKIILPFTLLAILGCSDNKQADVSIGRLLAANSSVGNGTVSSYAEFDKNGTPRAIGIVFLASALEGLPSAVSDEHHCFDRNKDGKVAKPSNIATLKIFNGPLFPS
jgi:hypothetical protein